MRPAISRRALFFTPEAPYPAIGGGALRSSSLFEYLLQSYEVDAITFREFGSSPVFPGAREVLVLDLPPHSRSKPARALRNLKRFAICRPPLLDRYSGFDAPIAAWLQGREYDVAIVEHFWCAPYAAALKPHTRRLIIDLHNVESALQSTTAAASSWPVSAMFARFASAYAALETEWLPEFDVVLTASSADRDRLPASLNTVVYPNALPYREQPRAARDHAIVFTGNLEYDPNVSAIRWFAAKIWPRIREQDPRLEWRLVGRNPHAVPRHIARLPGVNLVGEVEDAVLEIARAKAAVIPLLAGSGTRFKILEAWAAVTPVVSTPLGAEGLDAVDGWHLRLASTASEFAEAVVTTVRDPGMLGFQGRELYLERYTTDRAWVALRTVIS